MGAPQAAVVSALMDKVLSNTRVMASSIGVTRLCRALESQLGEDPMQRFAYGLCWRVSTFVCAICADPMSNAHARYDCRILPPSATSPSLQRDRGGHATGAGAGAGAGAGVGPSGSGASPGVDADDSAAYVAIAKRTTPSSVPLTPLPLEVACLAANRGRLIVDGITMEDLEVALDTQIAPGHQVRVCVCVRACVCVCVSVWLRVWLRVCVWLCVAVCGCMHAAHPWTQGSHNLTRSVVALRHNVAEIWWLGWRASRVSRVANSAPLRHVGTLCAHTQAVCIVPAASAYDAHTI